MSGLIELSSQPSVWPDLLLLIKSVLLLLTILFSLDTVTGSLERKNSNTIKLVTDRIAVTTACLPASPGGGRAIGLLQTWVYLGQASLLAGSRARFMARIVALANTGQLSACLLPLAHSAASALAISSLVLLSLFLQFPFIRLLGFILLALGLFSRLLAPRRGDFLSTVAMASGLFFVAVTELQQAALKLIVLSAESVMSPEHFAIIGLLALVLCWRLKSANAVILPLLVLSSLGGMRSTVFFTLLALALIGANLAELDLARQSGKRGRRHRTALVIGNFSTIGVAALAIYLSPAVTRPHEMLVLPLIILPPLVFGLAAGYSTYKQPACMPVTTSDSGSILTSMALQKLAENEFEACRARENLEVNIKQADECVASYLGSVTVLTMELLNASQLDSEAKPVLKRSTAIGTRLFAEINLLNKALRVCMGVAGNDHTRIAIDRQLKMAQGLYDLIHDCLSIARIFRKLHQKKALLDDQNMGSLFNLIASICDLLNYLGSFLTGKLDSLSDDVIGQMSSSIKTCSRELKTHSLARLEQDPRQNSRTDLAVLEINQKFASMAASAVRMAGLTRATGI